jgi:hypothetical protein
MVNRPVIMRCRALVGVAFCHFRQFQKRVFLPRAARLPRLYCHRPSRRNSCPANRRAWVQRILVQHSPLNLPLSRSEGLAELYSTIEEYGGKNWHRQPHPRLDHLRAGRLPLKNVLAAAPVLQVAKIKRAGTPAEFLLENAFDQSFLEGKKLSSIKPAEGDRYFPFSMQAFWCQASWWSKRYPDAPDAAEPDIRIAKTAHQPPPLPELPGELPTRASPSQSMASAKPPGWPTPGRCRSGLRAVNRSTCCAASRRADSDHQVALAPFGVRL